MTVAPQEPGHGMGEPPSDRSRLGWHLGHRAPQLSGVISAPPGTELRGPLEQALGLDTLASLQERRA